MPRWTFEMTPGTFTREEKHLIARQVTELYIARGLPNFFVIVFFHENGPDNFFSGGKNPPDAAFFHIDYAR